MTSGSGWVMSLAVAIGLMPVASLRAQSAESTAPVVFEKEIAPIFIAYCNHCHKGSGAKGGLDLTSAARVMKGGDAGPVLVSGSAEKSVLFKKVLDQKMPPPSEKNPLGDQQIDLIRKWIDGGAATTTNERIEVVSATPALTPEDRDFWSFRPPVAAPLPTPRDSARVRTPIDTFVLARLERKGLSFSADASPQTLVRRAYLDLLGLPPTPEDVQAFLVNTRPDAYDLLLDRLLDRPEYGERWGRHWLDTAGYTDAPHCDEVGALLPIDDWRYRDYVVQAFNRDKPYDRFLAEQLAGDELVPWRTATKYTPEMVEALTATGYLRTPPDWTHSDRQMIYPNYRTDVLSRVVDHVSSGILGLTMGCVRCHTHKFDPIPHQDYYRMSAVFATAYNLEDWKCPDERYLADVSKADQDEIASHNAKVDGLMAEQDKRIEELLRPHRHRLRAEKFNTVPEIVRDDVKAAFDKPADKRDEVERYLTKKFASVVNVSTDEAKQQLNAEEKIACDAAEQERARLRSSKRSFNKLQSLFDVGKPPTVRLLLRGDADTPGAAVEAGFITVLCAPDQSAAVPPPDTPPETSGRRLAFARWVTSRNHPLTARVMVNRVWQHHFGKGIVATPDNFGHSGMEPTHPELLDWLAVDFMEQGWTIKRLHKLIMTSTVYRQAANQAPGDAAAAADPDNDLLSRMNLRRLEAEALRDSVLALSGKLDRTVGGAPIAVESRPDGLVLIKSSSAPTSQWRRSLYLMSQRGSHASGKGFMLSMFEIFDFPEIVINCTRRSNSTTPLQSLALINSDFMTEQAGYFAQRVERTAGENATLEKKVEQAYSFALGRAPSSEEIESCVKYLREQTELFASDKQTSADASERALASLCLMLMASNEFLYIG